MTTNIAVAEHAESADTRHEATILRIAREVLARPGLGVNDDLFDNGATSLSFVRVLVRIKQDLHVIVRAAALGGLATASSLAAYVRAEKKGV